MEDERKQILQMLADGRISVDEASRLLAALDRPSAAVGPDAPPARRVRIRVHSRGGKQVNVLLPISVLKVVGWLPVDVNGQRIPVRDILDRLIEAGPGQVITVVEGDDGERVEVSFE